jgi:flavodoxin
LVIYYSFEGNTRFIAEALAGEICADILKLEPAYEKVPHNFMKYFWGGRQVVTKKMPHLLPFGLNIENYDVIFIGTPVWAFSYAPAIATFFNKVEIKGRKIGLFCCSGGMAANTFAKMKEKLAGNEFIAEMSFIEPLRHKEKSITRLKEYLSKINLDV